MTKEVLSSEFCLIYISTVLDGREHQYTMLARSSYCYVTYQACVLKRATLEKKKHVFKESMVLYSDKKNIVIKSD